MELPNAPSQIERIAMECCCNDFYYSRSTIAVDLRVGYIRVLKLMRRSIILTDWSAYVEYRTPSTSASDLVWELALLSLLYDTIFIQDEVLVLSETLASFFTPDLQVKNFEYQVEPLAELISIGALKILRFPTSAYPLLEQRENAGSAPIRTRSQYLKRYSTKNTERFAPSELQNSFHSYVDRLLSSHHGSHEEVEPDCDDYRMPFARKMREVLEDERYVPWIDSALGGISPSVREQLLLFVDDPERAKRAIYRAGVHRDRLLNRGPWITRSLLYRVAEAVFPSEQKQIRRLAESVFAADLCSRKLSAGRYSGALQELLVIPPDAEPHSIPSVPVVTVGPAIQQTIRLPELRSGFGQIIAEVRQSPAGMRLRESTSRAGTELDFRDQEDAWANVAEMLASRIDRGKQFRLKHLLFELRGKVGEALLAISLEEGVRDWLMNGATLESLASVGSKALAHGTLGLSLTAIFRLCGYHYRQQQLRERIQDAVGFRCGDIPFVGQRQTADKLNSA
jgi:hypothetical protein